MLAIVFVFLSYCAISSYMASTYSAPDYLRRLANVSERGTFDETRTAILQQLPVGTSKETIITYLEAQNIHADQFKGDQFMRYQWKDNERKLLVLLSDPPFPWTMNIACSQFGYIIHFDFNEQDQLINVVINSTAVCL
jgi:hypothetical protein